MNHSFDVNVAMQFGVNAAIVFQDMGFWCEHSRINRTNYHDGLYWTYNTVKALSEHWPYMSTKAIRTAIQKLIDAGLLITGNFNEYGWDRTLWYALTEKGESIFQNGKINSPKKENPKPKKGEPIPYTVSDTIPDIVIGAKAQRFTPPTLEQLQAYISEKGYTSDEIDPEYFIDHYTSNGWICGKSKMKDWQATVNNWVRRYRKEHPAPEPEKPYGLYCENLSPEEFMRLQQEQAEKDREEARRQGLL